MSPLRRVDPDSFVLKSKGTGKEPDWYRYREDFQNADAGDTFEVVPDDGVSMRKMKVMLTKAAESLDKGVAYAETVDDRTIATVLAAPRKRPAYKPKGDASAGTGRRGRPRKTQ